jgi:hypothetical protein
MLYCVDGLAQFYSMNLSAEVMKGIDVRVWQGRFASRTPCGYRKHAETDQAEPDPATWEALQHVFALLKSSRTDRAVAQALNAAGRWAYVREVRQLWRVWLAGHLQLPGD